MSLICAEGDARWTRVDWADELCGAVVEPRLAELELLVGTEPVMRARRKRAVELRGAARALAACLRAPGCVTPAAGVVGALMVVVTSLGVLPPHPTSPHRNKAVTNQDLELFTRVFYGAPTL
jgi:hypothetical protein